MTKKLSKKQLALIELFKKHNLDLFDNITEGSMQESYSELIKKLIELDVENLIKNVDEIKDIQHIKCVVPI